jgi:protein-L-isoaspartate(D-aspartate) O-methyltransferase
MDGVLGTAKVGFKSEGGVSWRPVFNATAPVLHGFARQRGFVL